MKNKITLKDVLAYIQGNIRYRLYNSNWSWLMRNHIKDQIDMRILSMNKSCYNQGSCIMCGCRTTHLQMANKTCDNPCYPSMMNKKQWKEINKKGTIFVDKNGTQWYIFEGRFTELKK